MLARGEFMVVEYEVLGSALDVVILLPALGADRRMWEPQIDALLPAYTVVLCETGGHHEPRAEPRALMAYADAVRATLDALAVQQVHIVGLSMGGMLAQIIAATWPQRVRSLVLMSTVATYDPAGREQLRTRARSAERDGMAPIVDHTVERWLSDDYRRQNTQATDAIRRMLLEANARCYAGAADAIAEVEIRLLLGQILAPTLVMSGAEDRSIGQEAAESLSGAIQSSRHVRISNGAHLCNVDSAAAVNLEMLRFLAKHSDAELDRFSTGMMW